MGFLEGKRILLTGLISNRSIAWGIAKACRDQSAELTLTCAGDRFKDSVEQFAKELGTNIVIPCDVSLDEDIENTFSTLSEHWDGLDGLVHSIGFAPRESIAGRFLDGLTRE